MHEAEQEDVKRPGAVWLAAVGEVALSLALGFYHLGHKSIWLDEGYSAIQSTGGWARAAGDSSAGGNMAGYNYLLSLWRVFGDGEFALRSLSVVAAGAAVFVVFLVGARLFSDAVGLVAGFVIAVSPIFVHFSQETRSYALTALLVSLASYFFVLSVERQRWWCWALYAVTAATSCYVHFTASFVILASAGSLLLLPPRRLPLRQILYTALGLGALLFPIVFMVPKSERSPSSNQNLRVVPGVISQIAGGRVLAIVVFGLCCIPLVLLVRALRTDGRSLDSWRLGFVLLWIAVPIPLALTAALTHVNAFEGRYMLVAVPALALGVGVAIMHLPSRALAAGFLVLIALLSAMNVANGYQLPAHEDWRGVAAYVTSAGAGPQDGLVFCPAWTRPPYQYYELREPPEDRPHPLSPSGPWNDELRWHPVHAQDVAGWSSTPQRIWVLSSYFDKITPAGGCDLKASMRGRKRTLRTTIGDVVIERYDLTGPAATGR